MSSSRRQRPFPWYQVQPNTKVLERNELSQELPIRIPVRKTRRPPITTWNSAEASGVSMYRWRIHEITANSTSTTPTATAVAVLISGIKVRQGMSQPAHRSHEAADEATSPRPPPAREAAVIGEGFGKTHADTAPRPAASQPRKFANCCGWRKRRQTAARASIPSRPSARPSRVGSPGAGTDATRLLPLLPSHRKTVGRFPALRPEGVLRSSSARSPRSCRTPASVALRSAVS